MSCAVSFSDILMSIKLSMVAEAEDCPSGTYGLHLIANSVKEPKVLRAEVSYIVISSKIIC